MLLCLTGSKDGSTGLLFERLGARAFRLNYDLFRDYRLTFAPGHWEIANPAGLTISSDSATAAFWWKAFNFRLNDEDPFIAEEVKYVFRELYAWFARRRAVRGNSPDWHHGCGKVAVLESAARHFRVPATVVAWGFPVGSAPLDGDALVAKSLTSGLTAANRALFTTPVDAGRLDPRFPWYLQERQTAEADVTVFVTGRKLFAFARSRASLTGVDWRAEQKFDAADAWDWYPLADEDRNRFVALNAALGIDWGRHDLLLCDGQLVYLEFNANGQWAFLDHRNRFGVLDAVVDYLSPA